MSAGIDAAALGVLTGIVIGVGYFCWSVIKWLFNIKPKEVVKTEKEIIPLKRKPDPYSDRPLPPGYHRIGK